MQPSHPHSLPATGRSLARALWLRMAAETLVDQGMTPSPVLDDTDRATLRSLDALLAQSIRAGRHTSGAVRAYASLISDAHGVASDTGHWASKIERAAGELDDFSARLGTLRVCENEKPTRAAWGDVMAHVAGRCGSVGRCVIEVNDRTRGPFRQRMELIARACFHVVRNAVEATPRNGRVTVRIDEMRIASERSFLVRVTDTGPGIDPRVRADMWRPFMTTRPGHAGLGLTFVATALPVLGAVAGFSSDGRGTSVQVLLAEEGDLEW